jgi:tRNA uridine 5-carboxymethylaminomethyl modification enzyme
MSLSEGKFANPEFPVDGVVAAAAAVPTDILDLEALTRGVNVDAGVAPADVFVASVVEQVEIAAKYSGYIGRQKDEVERASHYENLRLPAELDYMQVKALSIEARQRLNKRRPETLGQASRLSGITPATISLLLIHLKKGNFKGFVDRPVVAGVEAAA